MIFACFIYSLSSVPCVSFSKIRLCLRQRQGPGSITLNVHGVSNRGPSWCFVSSYTPIPQIVPEGIALSRIIARASHGFEVIFFFLDCQKIDFSFLLILIQTQANINKIVSVILCSPFTEFIIAIFAMRFCSTIGNDAAWRER